MFSYKYWNEDENYYLYVWQIANNYIVYQLKFFKSFLKSLLKK